MKQPLIFFDLGGVLLLEADRSVKKLAKHAHINLFLRTFEFASLLLGPDTKDKWFLGELASSDIIDAINNNIDTPQYASFFQDADELNLIKYGCRSFLVPELLAENTHIIPEGLEFVKKCKANDIEIAIISNWEKPSFELVRNKMPELFNLFDDRTTIIPAKVGYTKPHPKIYEYSLHLTGHTPESCIFIDDSASNVAGAQKYGIPSILHKNWKDTEDAIRNLGVQFIS